MARRTQLVFAPGELLHGEFRVLHRQRPQPDEPARVFPYCVRQVIVQQLRQVQTVRTLRLIIQRKVCFVFFGEGWEGVGGLGVGGAGRARVRLGGWGGGRCGRARERFQC